MAPVSVETAAGIDTDVLASSPAFAGLAPTDAQRLLGMLGARVQTYADGQAVLEQGQPVNYYPVVVRGGVRAFLVQRGRERPVARMGQGESFAEAAASMPACPVNVSAEGPTDILQIPAAALDACMEPAALALKANIRAKMAQRIGTLAQNIAVIGEPRLEDRIVRDLEARPHGADGWVELPATQRAWASYLRVDEKVLSRKLREMREAGVLELEEHRARLLA